MEWQEAYRIACFGMILTYCNKFKYLGLVNIKNNTVILIEYLGELKNAN